MTKSPIANDTDAVIVCLLFVAETMLGLNVNDPKLDTLDGGTTDGLNERYWVDL